jgi:hypothetical protein
MKFNININQYQLSKNKDITIQDSAVIDWLFTICGSDSEKINKKRVEGWTWVSLTHLINDMPLLRIKTNSGASKLIRRVKDLGFIESKKDNKERKLYVRPTAKLRDLYFSKGIKSEVLTETSQVLTETSQVLEDTYHNTNTLILKPNTVVSEETTQVYSFKEELEKLKNSRWVVDKIIYNYWKIKGFVFENKKQFESAKKREIRPAKALEGYNSTQINKAFDFCEIDSKEKNYNWSLETVGKKIATLINKK